MREPRRGGENAIPLQGLGSGSTSAAPPFAEAARRILRIPTMRVALAVALSLIVAHVLGGAFSPSLVGGPSDLMGHDLAAAMRLTLPAVILAAGVVCLLGLKRVAPDMLAGEAQGTI